MMQDSKSYRSGYDSPQLKRCLFIVTGTSSIQRTAGGASAEPVWTSSAPWGTSTGSSSSSSSSHSRKGLSSAHLLLQNVTQDWPHSESSSRSTAANSNNTDSNSIASDMAFVYPVLEPCTADGMCLLASSM
jgi:hypothetical protein